MSKFLSFFQRTRLLIKICIQENDAVALAKIVLGGNVHKLMIRPERYSDTRELLERNVNNLADLLCVARQKDFQQASQAEHKSSKIFAQHVEACIRRNDMGALATITQQTQLQNGSWAIGARHILNLSLSDGHNNDAATILLSFLEKQCLTHNGAESGMDVALEAARQNNSPLILWLWHKQLFAQIKKSIFFKVLPDVLKDINTPAGELLKEIFYSSSAHKNLNWTKKIQELEQNPAQILWPKSTKDVEIRNQSNT